MRPELKPIAERYGRDMLDFAVRVAGANSALDALLVATRHNLALRSRTAALLDAQGYFCGEFAKLKGWNWPRITECIQDIARAAKLARGGMVPPPDSTKTH